MKNIKENNGIRKNRKWKVCDLTLGPEVVLYPEPRMTLTPLRPTTSSFLDSRLLLRHLRLVPAKKRKLEIRKRNLKALFITENRIPK
jgi:hypothetical protein